LRGAQLAIVAWGVGGVLLLLGQALGRLVPLAVEPLLSGMTWGQWSLYVGWMLVNGYAEGYRGFQLRFAPRVVARAVHLAAHPRPWHVLLAPLFCMSFFHATRRGRAIAWGVSLGVAAAVALIRFVPQPWRGILDAGVVVGLGWGALSLVVLTVNTLRGRPPTVDPELPEAEGRTLSSGGSSGAVSCRAVPSSGVTSSAVSSSAVSSS
jgi:hypothetical protein